MPSRSGCPGKRSREILVDLFPDATKRIRDLRTAPIRRSSRTAVREPSSGQLSHVASTKEASARSTASSSSPSPSSPILRPILRRPSSADLRLPRGDEELAKYAVASPLLDSREDLPAIVPGAPRAHPPRRARAARVPRRSPPTRRRRFPGRPWRRGRGRARRGCARHLGRRRRCRCRPSSARGTRPIASRARLPRRRTSARYACTPPRVPA